MAKTINQFQRESRMDCYAENAQLRAENEKLAAALAHKQAKIKADAVMQAFEWAWSRGSLIPKDAYAYVKRIERGEE